MIMCSSHTRAIQTASWAEKALYSKHHSRARHTFALFCSIIRRPEDKNETRIPISPISQQWTFFLWDREINGRKEGSNGAAAFLPFLAWHGMACPSSYKDMFISS